MKTQPIIRRSVLLLHGVLGASSQFAPLIPLLGDTYEIHTLDFEGHGTSKSQDRPFSTRGFSENVLEYMDQHAIQSADVFGHSMGGQVGIYMAIFFPERIRRVFTLGTKFHWTPEIAERENLLLDPDRIKEKVPHFAKVLQERHAAMGWEVLLEKLKAFHCDLGVNNPLKDEDIQKIGKRVRICVGDRDKMVTFEESIRVYRLLKEGELQVLPRTPHPLEKVAIDLLSQAIIDFFE